MKIEIERLINSNNVKYNLLIPMVNQSFTGSSSDTLNIYIDMYSIFRILYSNIDIQLGDYNNLASCLVNIASHYRNFFYTRYKVNTKFYFIYSNNTPYINKQFVPNYNMKSIDEFMAKKDISRYITTNLSMFDMIVPYLPDLFYIESAFETGVAIYDLMCRVDKNNTQGHLIITKDVYNFQLVNMKPQTVILRTKRNDESYIIDKYNVLSSYFSERNVKTESKTLSPDLLTAIMTLSSVKERNINTMFNISKAVNLLQSAVNKKLIMNGYNSDLSYLWNAIRPDECLIDYTTFEWRFKSIDIQFQHSIYVNTPECIGLDGRLVNKYDPEGIKAINNEHFKNNPLDLNRL